MYRDYSRMSMEELDQEFENQKNYWRGLLDLEYLSAKQISKITGNSVRCVRNTIEKTYGYPYIVDRTINSHGAHLYKFSDVDRIFGINNIIRSVYSFIKKTYYENSGIVYRIIYYFEDCEFVLNIIEKDEAKIQKEITERAKTIYGYFMSHFDLGDRPLEHEAVNFITDILKGKE